MGYLHKSIIKRLSNNFGFMLIEIIIVLIITGLMVALFYLILLKPLGVTILIARLGLWL